MPASPHRPPESLAVRMGFGFGGLVVVVLAVCWMVFVIGFGLKAAAVPDPFEATGFLCCNPPDTWWQAGLNVAIAMMVAAVEVSLWVAATWMFGRPVRWRVMRRAAAIGAAAMLVAVSVPIARSLDQAVVSPDCDAYAFDRRAFLSDHRSEAREEALGLARCRALVGMTGSQVRAMLDPVDRRDRPRRQRREGSRVSTLFYQELTVEFVGGRVRGARINREPEVAWD